MPFDGYGTFLRLRSWVVDATNSVKIRADFHDAEDNNFAAGLSQCITKDGQTSITQNLPLNSRRIISLADPIDPQDASTKAYADTKASLSGSAPFTGDVLLKEDTPSLTLDGKVGNKSSIFGQKADKNRWEIVLGNATAEGGSNAGSDFELVNYADDGTRLGDVLFGTRSTGLLTVKGDPTTSLGIATKQYIDTVAATKLPLAGGTITGSLVVAGNLQVNGELLAVQNYIRFGYTGSPGYLIWNGGASYSLGGAGTIWHSGNFNPASGTFGRWVVIGQWQIPYNGSPGDPAVEPFNGGVMTGLSSLVYVPGQIAIQYIKFRRLQISTDGVNYYSIGYVG